MSVSIVRKKIKASELKSGNQFYVRETKRTYKCCIVNGKKAGKTEKGEYLFFSDDLEVYLLMMQLKMF